MMMLSRPLTLLFGMVCFYDATQGPEHAQGVGRRELLKSEKKESLRDFKDLTEELTEKALL